MPSRSAELGLDGNNEVEEALEEMGVSSSDSSSSVSVMLSSRIVEGDEHSSTASDEVQVALVESEFGGSGAQLTLVLSSTAQTVLSPDESSMGCSSISPPFVETSLAFGDGERGCSRLAVASSPRSSIAVVEGRPSSEVWSGRLLVLVVAQSSLAH